MLPLMLVMQEAKLPEWKVPLLLAGQCFCCRRHKDYSAHTGEQW